jgi:hypothetical protein
MKRIKSNIVVNIVHKHCTTAKELFNSIRHAKRNSGSVCSPCKADDAVYKQCRVIGAVLALNESMHSSAAIDASMRTTCLRFKPAAAAHR